MKVPQVKRPSEEVLRKVQSLEGKKGMLVAIEPDSGDYFFGKTTLEALKEAREKYPEGFFYLVRVGYPSAHAHKGGIRRL